MHSLALYIHGNDEHGRMLRRTLIRYLNLTLILVLRSISSAVKRRFPTMDHLVQAGFITAVELQLFQSVPSKEFNTYWIPCSWFICLLKQARKTNRITDPQGLKLIVEEFNEFRSKCGLLWSFDWISIPLVYTQVVTLATYSFFLAALVGRQYVENADNSVNISKKLQMEIDRYIPVFTILQFFFFMGLLKVAEQLINPFGDDDEDFELNWLIDRHTKVSYLGVDTLMTRCPPLVKDKYFDDVDVSLPYTGAAFAYKKKTYRGSVHDMQVPEEQQSMFLPEIIEEDEEEEGSTRQCSPKTSFSSIHETKRGKNGSSSQTAEGIWRIDSLKLLHETPSMEENVEQCLEMVIGHEGELPEECSVQNQSDLFAWPSNSTLESFSSTVGFQANEMNEFVNCMEQQQPPGAEATRRVQRSVSSVLAKPAAHGNNSAEFVQRSASKETLNESARKTWQKILARRQSSSSGHKGVRWKPVLHSSASDSWNALRQQQMRPICVQCLSSGNKAAAPTPAASTPVLVQAALHHHVVDETHTLLGRRRPPVLAASLPNISVPFLTNLSIPNHSNSLRTIPPNKDQPNDAQTSSSNTKCGDDDNKNCTS
ncbi:bestrophin-1 isoform X3 [Nilaparvata lugens]|nr:bestrophin-1 isoform X3 [Nilaparvata lugens]